MGVFCLFFLSWAKHDYLIHWFIFATLIDSITNCKKDKWFSTIHKKIVSICLPLPRSHLPGDKRHRAGLQAASSHGLSSRAAPADAGLLAEGPLGTPSLRRPRQCSGQADPQPRIAENSGSRRSRVRVEMCLSDWHKACPNNVIDDSEYAARECTKERMSVLSKCLSPGVRLVFQPSKDRH